MNQTCKTCRWWVDEGEKTPSGSSIGDCHRLPPQCRPDNYGTFPVTFDDDFCGEWKPHLPPGWAEQEEKA
jgi:hypothetical protein